MGERMRVYLAGPISSKPYDVARRDFNAAARLLEGLGLEAVNPMDRTFEGMPREECMRTAIGKLLECDGVALLPGWHESEGAWVEAQVARQCGIVAREIGQWAEIRRREAAHG